MMRKLLKPPSRKSDQNLRNLQGKYLRRSYVIVKPFFAINSNFTYDSETYDLMKLYFETLHSEPVEQLGGAFFCRNGERVKTVSYFRRRALSWMFDRILNETLPSNLL